MTAEAGLTTLVLAALVLLLVAYLRLGGPVPWPGKPHRDPADRAFDGHPSARSLSP